ncbi:MAG: regulator of sigma E protease [Polaribacter sp.]|jgi:regulator of sigma E protease
MGLLITIGQLILSLSILIILHELGHFIPARMFGTRVEKFYLFFDPWFELFKFKRGDTEYGIGWLPLGGYVKISGMIDESMDREQMKQPAEPWEFRSKKAWQRLVIMLGGVTVNFILGFFLYGMVLFTWGESFMPTKNIVDGIYVDSLGMELGLQDGDKILRIDEAPFDKFNDGLVKQAIIFNDAKVITVDRNGSEVNLPIDPDFIGKLTAYENKGQGLFGPRYPVVVKELSEDDNYPAKKAGILEGDKIIAVNNSPTPFYHNYEKLAIANKGKKIDVSILRSRDTLSIPLTLLETGQMGVIVQLPEFDKEKYSFFPAMVAGTQKGWSFLADQITAFGHMFKGKIKASESLGGFASIGKMFGDTWDWERFWKMTAILSLILGFMNLLPIPALDGGHVMFLLYEVISGRKPSDRFMEISTIAGFVIVMGLVLYANGMDVVRWWKG